MMRGIPAGLAATLLLFTLPSCKEEEEKPPAPTATAITPASGLMSGGTAVTITGANLDGAQVTMGGASATVQSAGGSSITATTPPGMRGAAEVSITNKGGSTQVPGGFRYLSPVSVTMVEPSTIGTVGTFNVVLRGGGLFPPVNVAVSGGGTNASFTAGLGTEFAVPVDISGLAPGMYAFTITNGDMQSVTLNNALTVGASALPNPQSVSPSRGLERGGNALRLVGTNFTGANAVSVGGTAVTGFQVGNSGQELVFNAPAGQRGARDISVTTPSGTGTLAAAYTYTRSVVVQALNPPQIAQQAATTVTIQGTGMVGPVRVSLSRNNMPQQVQVQAGGTESSVTISVPALEAGDYAVTVVNADGESAASPSELRVRNGLALTAIKPVGVFTDESTTVEITGPDITGVTQVVLGTVECGAVQLVTTQRVRCTVPAGTTAGVVDVFVRRGTESEGVLAQGFEFVSPGDPALRVLGVEPAGGRSTGGEQVAVLASGIGAGPTVVLGGVSAPVQGIQGGRRIIINTPARTLAANVNALAVDVSVTAGGSTETLPGGFRFHRRPSFTAATPNKGATVGGDRITINGEGFTPEGTTVLFDGIACSEVLVLSTTALTCRIPRHALGFADLVVVNEFDQSQPANDAFEYVEAVRIVSTDPPVFSVAGGTIVEATGSGFAANQMRITVVEDGSQATNVNVINGTTLRFTTPARATAGVVTLRVEDTGRAGQPFSFGEGPAEYVDPTVEDGGAGGGVVNRNISVTVLRSDTGARIPNAAVFSGPSWQSAFARGTTNARGMVVIARDPMVGPLSLTAAANGFASTTYAQLNANEVTFRLDPFVATPPPLPPTSTVSGVVTNWQGAGYPANTDPNRLKRIAVILPTEPEPGRLGVSPGQQFVVSETPCDITRDGIANPLGQQFTLQVETGRTIALIAMVFFYDSVDGSCNQMEMQEGLVNLTAAGVGLLGPIVVGAGTNPANNISINYPNSLDWTVSLVGAPSLNVGTAYSADGILDLGAMGSFTFYAGVGNQPSIGFFGSYPYLGLVALPDNLLALANIASGMPVTGGVPPYTFRGVAGLPLTDGGGLSGYQQPYTEVFARGITTNSVNLNGFYALPSNFDPSLNGILVNRRFSWASLGRSDGLVIVDILSGTQPRWTILAPGGTTSVTLPSLAGAPVNTDLVPGGAYTWHVQGLTLWPELNWTFNDHTIEPLNHVRNWAAHTLGADVLFGL